MGNPDDCRHYAEWARVSWRGRRGNEESQRQLVIWTVLLKVTDRC